MDSSTNSRSNFYRWDFTHSGFSFTHTTFTNVFQSSSGSYIRQLYAMDDVELFFTYNGQNGYYLLKFNSTSDAYLSGPRSFDTTKSWMIFQTRFNNIEDIHPVYVSSSDVPGTFYKATNLLTLHFITNSTQYDFHAYPADFGRYYAMQIKPGTCVQEGGGSKDYNTVHLNILSIRDKAHVVCIDDSEDIYCGNAKWEEYNLEECDGRYVKW